MVYRPFLRKYSKNCGFHSVTTPIFYVNAAPHIGHLYTAVIADAINRFQNLKYPDKKLHFTTGTDEHGTKIQQAAELHQIPVKTYSNNITQNYRNVFNKANIKYTDFISTSEDRHKKSVQHFWNLLKSKNCIYSNQYSGWYCVSDETFLTENQLKTNSNGKKVSIESGHPVEWTEEVNYMFQLNKFQHDIYYWIKGNDRIKPNKFEKVLLNYIDNTTLPDISISRPISRVHWGIQVPDDPQHTVYVWLDALVNYLTCAGYPDKMYYKLWPPNLQVIGKDILKFHGIYWPAFLIAAGMEPPKRLLVHSHWTVNDEKMSKSKSNVVDPIKCAETYTMEGLRYFLLREGVAHSDGNFSETKLLRILNSELADTLGNLLSRACAITLNPRQIYPKINELQYDKLYKLDSTKRLIDILNQLGDKCEQHYMDYNFYLVCDQVIAALHACNNFFETTKPWEVKKSTTQQNLEKLETIIGITMHTLRLCGIILQPIIPDISTRLLDKLNIPLNERYWKNIIFPKLTELNFIECILNEEKSLGTNTNSVLFQRIILKKENINVEKIKLKKNVKKLSY